MDLKDLYSDLEDGEAEELGLVSFAAIKGALPVVGGVAPAMRAPVIRPRVVIPAVQLGARAAAIRKRVGVPAPRIVAMDRRALPRNITPAKVAAAKLAAKKLPARVAAKIVAKRALPLPVSQPAAYRHLCANAGMGGSSAIALLNDINTMVKRAEVRDLATSEHNVLNNTQAFRAEVLKNLTAQLRARRSKG